MKLSLAAFAAILPVAALAEPVWIWTKKIADPQEQADFRLEFEVAGEIKSALLTLTCDNGATASINGGKVLENADWQRVSRANVKRALRPGKNEIVVQARNRGGAAALVAQLDIETADGKKMVVETSDQWLATAHGGSDWKPVVAIAKYGDGPWGLALGGKGGKGKDAKPRKTNDGPDIATAPKDITAPPGFKVELLYTVPKAEQGSWVSMTVDKKGRLLCGDQYGGIYRVTPPPIGSGDKAKVEKLDVPASAARTACSMRMIRSTSCSMKAARPRRRGCKPGLYRLKDKDGDDHFDEPVLLSAVRRAAASTGRTPSSSRRTGRASSSTAATTPSCRRISAPRARR